MLVGLFLAQFIFISPKGEFALNDDWVHTDTIKHWVETGEFRLMPFAGPSFYVPILYGTAITKIFGFSFTSLRISTLILALFLLATFYFLLNRLSNKPALSFLATLILWSNPIIYNLSFTFMTDIPALAFLLLSIYFYYSGFEKANNKLLFWGSIFGLLSAYTRQTGILIIFSTLAYALIHLQTYKLKHLLTSFGIPLAIGGAIYIYLTVFNLIPQSTFTHQIMGIGRLLGHIKWWLWYIPMYLGLFTLPLTIGWFFSHHKWKDRKLWLIGAIIGGMAILIRQIWHLQFPYIGNNISLYGLGPMKNVLEGTLTTIFPSYIWGIITLFCAFGFTLLINIFWHRRGNNEPNGFIYLFGLLYLTPILLFDSFDRYLLPLFIVLLIALFQNLKHLKYSYFFPIILIGVSMYFSITQTQFYLKWNEARWNLANQTISDTTKPNQIDAGYEWNGWTSYWDNVKIEKKEDKSSHWWIGSLFPLNTREYVVSFSPLADYNVVSEKQIEGWNANNKTYLLHKMQITDGK